MFIMSLFIFIIYNCFQNITDNNNNKNEAVLYASVNPKTNYVV